MRTQLVLTLAAAGTIACTISTPVDNQVTPDLPDCAVTALSCSYADLTDAVDAVRALNGGVVCVPAGNCAHGSESLQMPIGISLIGAGEERTVIDGAYFYYQDIYGLFEQPTRISSMRLSGASGIFCRGFDRGLRVDHMDITGDNAVLAGPVISIQETPNALVDHNRIAAMGNQDCVVVSQGYDQSYPEMWQPDVSALLGGSNAVFVEDNQFAGCAHGVTGFANSIAVVRYNTFNDLLDHEHEGNQVESHGPGLGPPTGNRLMEIYHNTFNAIPSYDWMAITIRSGSAVVFDNVFNGYDNAVALTYENSGYVEDAPYGEGMLTQDVWIWNNEYNGLGGNGAHCPCDYLQGTASCCEVFVRDFDTVEGLDIQEAIREETTFYLRAPNLVADGFDYTPYTYPHPDI